MKKEYAIQITINGEKYYFTRIELWGNSIFLTKNEKSVYKRKNLDIVKKTQTIIEQFVDINRTDEHFFKLNRTIIGSTFEFSSDKTFSNYTENKKELLNYIRCDIDDIKNLKKIIEKCINHINIINNLEKIKNKKNKTINIKIIDVSNNFRKQKMNKLNNE